MAENTGCTNGGLALADPKEGQVVSLQIQCEPNHYEIVSKSLETVVGVCTNLYCFVRGKSCKS